MTTATLSPNRATTLTASKRPIATSATPARRSVIARWLVAMVEQAQVRGVDHPEFAEYVAARR